MDEGCVDAGSEAVGVGSEADIVASGTTRTEQRFGVSETVFSLKVQYGLWPQKVIDYMKAKLLLVATFYQC